MVDGNGNDGGGHQANHISIIHFVPNSRFLAMGCTSLEVRKPNESFSFLLGGLDIILAQQ